MTIRISNLTHQGNSIFRDDAKRAHLEVVVSEDDAQDGVGIEGNTVNFISRRNIVFSINSITVYGREVPILQGALKLKFAAANPNSITEKICEEIPITNGENNVVFSKQDIIDTLEYFITVIGDNNLLIP